MWDVTVAVESRPWQNFDEASSVKHFFFDNEKAEPLRVGILCEKKYFFIGTFSIDAHDPLVARALSRPTKMLSNGLLALEPGSLERQFKHSGRDTPSK